MLSMGDRHYILAAVQAWDYLDALQMFLLKRSLHDIVIRHIMLPVKGVCLECMVSHPYCRTIFLLHLVSLGNVS